MAVLYCLYFYSFLLFYFLFSFCSPWVFSLFVVFQAARHARSKSDILHPLSSDSAYSDDRVSGFLPCPWPPPPSCFSFLANHSFSSSFFLFSGSFQEGILFLLVERTSIKCRHPQPSLFLWIEINLFKNIYCWDFYPHA